MEQVPSPPGNDNQSVPSVTPPGPSKAKSVRIIFDQRDYLLFHDLVGRLIFSKKLTERQTDEEVIKLAIRRLHADVMHTVGTEGNQFVSSDSLCREQ